MSTIKVNNIENRTGSSITIGGSSTTSLDLASTITGGTLTNTPMFFGRKASNQTITRATWTKLTGMTADEIDTDNAFDGTTFTVPSGKAGKYYITSGIDNDFSGIGNDGFQIIAKLYINNVATYTNTQFRNNNNQIVRYPTVLSVYVDLSVGDTLEIYVYTADSDGGNSTVNSNNTWFAGHKLIGV